MSYEEYNDLFLKAQKNEKAKYMAFVLDIKNSRKMDNETREYAQLKTFNTIDLMIEFFKTLEKEKGKKILVDELPVLKVDNITKPKSKMLNYLNNPCVAFGDSFAFYCYSNSITKEKFNEIFKFCAKLVGNNIKYHFISGKFETLFYNEANEKYYIGYALEKLCKEKNSMDENLL